LGHEDKNDEKTKENQTRMKLTSMASVNHSCGSSTGICSTSRKIKIGER